MEKRLLLSIVLSLFVLWVWFGIISPPPEREQLRNLYESSSQDIGIEEVTEDTKSVVQKPLETIAPPPTLSANREKIETIVTDKLSVNFSDFGGNIKSIQINEYEHELPLTKINNIPAYQNIIFQLESVAENGIIYSYEDNDFKVRKSYVISDDDFIIQSTIDVVNKSQMSKLINIVVDGFTIDANSLDNKKNGNPRYNMMLEYSVSYQGFVNRKRNAAEFKDKEDNVEQKEVDWLGFRDQYFCLIAKPDFSTREYIIEEIDKKRLRVAMKSDSVKLAAGEKASFPSTIYYGPQDIKTLKSYDMGLEDIVDFKMGGFFDIMAFGLTDFIAKIMLAIIGFIHGIIPNWGVAIIIMAVIVYGSTYPLTYSGMKKMKDAQQKSSAIQPEMNKIREKYKDNPQKMNQAMMELYKKHNFNPMSMLSGCLPMFLQAPIFIGLIQLLWRSYNFKGASFLWIKDLSEPDRLATLPFSLPYFGNELNILPILYAILLFIQQKMQSKNMVAADPQQAEMQKMMATIFPLMLGVLFYKFSSGVALYFTVYFMLNAITQWKISKEQKAA